MFTNKLPSYTRFTDKLPSYTRVRSSNIICEIDVGFKVENQLRARDFPVFIMSDFEGIPQNRIKIDKNKNELMSDDYTRVGIFHKISDGNSNDLTFVTDKIQTGAIISKFTKIPVFVCHSRENAPYVIEYAKKINKDGAVVIAQHGELSSLDDQLLKKENILAVEFKDAEGNELDIYNEYFKSGENVVFNSIKHGIIKSITSSCSNPEQITPKMMDKLHQFRSLFICDDSEILKMFASVFINESASVRELNNEIIKLKDRNDELIETINSKTPTSDDRIPYETDLLKKLFEIMRDHFPNEDSRMKNDRPQQRKIMEDYGIKVQNHAQAILYIADRNLRKGTEAHARKENK
jgi:hypothetical protein